MHFGKRYYDPGLGRWTQQDPIDQPADLRQANRYVYVGQDPVNHVDPSGEILITVVRLAYIGVRAAARNPKVQFYAGKYANQAALKARQIAEFSAKAPDKVKKFFDLIGG